MKKIKRAVLAVLRVLAVLLTGRDDQAVDDGICDYSGQGRDGYGR